MRRVTLAAVLLATACGGQPAAGPWNTYPGVDGHARYFPLSGTAHDPSAPSAAVSCDACHPGTTFAAFDCATCHDAPRTDPIHATVTGYVHASPDCLRCHPDGTVAAPPDHDTRFFPRGAGSAHAAVGGYCTQCHTDLAAPADPAHFKCATCHATQPGFSTAHAAVAGVSGATESVECLACHGDSQVDHVAAHGEFPIARGSSTHDTACLQCHTAKRSDKTFAQDFSRYDCTACHENPGTDSAHTGVDGYVYASASCYGCHPGGTSAPADHDTRFFPAAFAGTKHRDAGVTCTDCHTDPAHPTDPTRFACGTCHLQRDAALVTKHTGTSTRALRVLSSEISTSDSRTCLRCHADSQLVTAHPSGGTGYPPHEGAACLQCHDVYRSDKPFGIDFASNPALASKLASRTGCYHCHTSAPPRGD